MAEILVRVEHAAGGQRVGEGCRFAQHAAYRLFLPLAALLVYDELMANMILKQFFGDDGQLRAIEHKGEQLRFLHRAGFAGRFRFQRGACFTQRVRFQPGRSVPGGLTILLFDPVSVFVKLIPEHHPASKRFFSICIL